MSENTHQRIRVAAPDELPEGTAKVVKAGDAVYALYRVEGRCYATANACPHRGGPLGEGALEAHVVTCPWHGWTWDVRTGANLRQPALRKLACFPVTEEEGGIFIDVPAP